MPILNPPCQKLYQGKKSKINPCQGRSSSCSSHCVRRVLENKLTLRVWQLVLHQPYPFTQRSQPTKLVVEQDSNVLRIQSLLLSLMSFHLKQAPVSMHLGDWKFFSTLHLKKLDKVNVQSCKYTWVNWAQWTETGNSPHKKACKFWKKVIVASMDAVLWSLQSIRLWPSTSIKATSIKSAIFLRQKHVLKCSILAHCLV